MREEIEEMEREIAGEAPVPPPGATQRIRIAFNTAETSDPHKFYFRSTSPPTFERKMLKEASIALAIVSGRGKTPLLTLQSLPLLVNHCHRIYRNCLIGNVKAVSGE
jgi:hypothetical protein